MSSRPRPTETHLGRGGSVIGAFPSRIQPNRSAMPTTLRNDSSVRTSLPEESAVFPATSEMLNINAAISTGPS